MEEFKESIKDLKKQLSDFLTDYYKELIKIWSKIVEIETKQKHLMMIYGTMISVSTSIITAMIIFYLKGK